MSDPKKEKVEVKLPENVPVDYTFEKMLKQFTKTIEKSGIIKEIRARRYYIKPSEKKREAAKRRRK